MATLYRIECTVTGKSYIGVCLRSVKERWNNHCASARQGSKYPLHAAIRKYGTPAFKRYVILRNLPEDLKQLAKLEADYIEKRGTLYPNGYNRRKGGGTFRHSEETKRKMSEARKRWMADPNNAKRVGEALSKTKQSKEGKARMVAAAYRSWETRRNRYTEDEIKKIAKKAAQKRNSKDIGKKSWLTRRKNYTKEEISKQSSEGLKKWHAKVRQLLEQENKQ